MLCNICLTAVLNMALARFRLHADVTANMVRVAARSKKLGARERPEAWGDETDAQTLWMYADDAGIVSCVCGVSRRLWRRS